MTRDEFLCDKMGYEIPYSNPPFFSTWDGFGKLWEWAREQEWYNDFIYDNHWIQTELIHPDRFADAVALCLGWEEENG